MNKKGLVIVICAPSQGGKDFIAQNVIDYLTNIEDFDAFFATTYKVRKARVEEAEYIHCVESEKDIPVPKTDQISVTIYDTQKVAYDKKEISNAIEDGKIVIIATGSPEAAVKIKNEFDEHCINVFVKRQQVNEKIMVEEDLKRYGILSTEATELQLEESYLRVRKRIEHYEKMKSQYVQFVADEKNGADFIFRNWFTLVGGEWNSNLDEVAKNEFYSLYNFIISVHKYINSNYTASWRNKKKFTLDKSERQIDPMSLQEDWFEYISKKFE